MVVESLYVWLTVKAAHYSRVAICVMR